MIRSGVGLIINRSVKWPSHPNLNKCNNATDWVPSLCLGWGWTLGFTLSHHLHLSCSDSSLCTFCTLRVSSQNYHLYQWLVLEYICMVSWLHMAFWRSINQCVSLLLSHTHLHTLYCTFYCVYYIVYLYLCNIDGEMNGKRRKRE